MLVILVALHCALLCCAADRPAPHRAAIAPSSAGDSDASSTHSQHVPRSLDDDLRLFNDFIREHGRTYQDEEKLRRFQIFRRTLYRIDRLNAESEHAVFGVNQFSDLEPWEFQRRSEYGSDTDDDKYTLKYLIDEDMKLVDPPPPDSLDYRKKGVVTPAKDQGNCSSDWAFSLTGNIEGMYALKYKRLYNLSEQLILDCTKHGCSEWNILKAIGAVVYVPGMMTEQNYPYLGRNSSECKLKESQVVVKPRVYEHWILSKEDNFRELLVARGPLSVEVAAEPLQDYKSGIINGAACHQKKPFVKQAVLLVGYGTENKIPFWILKNSWGSKWGEGGYFRIRRQVNCMDMHHNLIICVRF